MPLTRKAETSQFQQTGSLAPRWKAPRALGQEWLFLHTKRLGSPNEAVLLRMSPNYHTVVGHTTLILSICWGRWRDRGWKSEIVTLLPNPVSGSSVASVSLSVQFSCSVVSDSATHGLQHARPLCPSPTPRAYSNSCPLSQWCHPTISSSVIPFSSRLQSFPVSGSFQMSQFFASGGQSIGVHFSIRPSNEYSVLISFRMDWLDLHAVQGTLKNLLQHHTSKASVLWHSVFFIVQLSHPYITTGKTIALTRRTFVAKVMSLLSNMLSRSVITFLPRSKRLLISWLQSPSAVILEPPQIKSDTVSTVFPSICHEVMGPDAMILVFWVLSFKPTLSLSSFTFIRQPSCLKISITCRGRGCFPPVGGACLPEVSGWRSSNWEGVPSVKASQGWWPLPRVANHVQSEHQGAC